MKTVIQFFLIKIDQKLESKQRGPDFLEHRYSFFTVFIQLLLLVEHSEFLAYYCILDLVVVKWICHITIY